MALLAGVVAGDYKDTDNTLLTTRPLDNTVTFIFYAQDTRNKIKIAPASAERSGAPEIK